MDLKHHIHQYNKLTSNERFACPYERHSHPMAKQTTIHTILNNHIYTNIQQDISKTKQIVYDNHIKAKLTPMNQL